MSLDELIGTLVTLYLIGSIVAGIVRGIARRSARGEALPFPFPKETGKAMRRAPLPGDRELSPPTSPASGRGIESSAEGVQSPEEGTGAEGPAEGEAIAPVLSDRPARRGGLSGPGRKPKAAQAIATATEFDLGSLVRVGLLAREILGPPRSLRPHRPMGWRRP